MNVHRHVTVFMAFIFAFIVSVFASSACFSATLSIQNTAQVTFVVDGSPTQLSSNTVVTSVNPLVDVKNIALAAQLDLIQADVTGYTYSFIVTNTGNRPDRFEMTAGFTNISAPVAALWIDNNHNNLFDPALDTQISPNGLGVLLAPGESATVLVLAEAGGTMRLTATSLNDDPLAVVRHRSAATDITPRVPVNLNNTRAAVTLTKSQEVDMRGEAQAGKGSLITYSLVARVPSSVGASNIRINDTVPAGTTYVPGSLSLDAEPLSDTADSDEGAFDTADKSISVALPAPDASQSTATVQYTVRFQVRIN
jgi:uncharacterized repeat protein (TIGR01451 family)